MFSPIGTKLYLVLVVTYGRTEIYLRFWPKTRRVVEQFLNWYLALITDFKK